MHWLENWLIPLRCVLTGLPTFEHDLSSELIESWHRPEAVCPQCCELSALGEICGSCLAKPPAFDCTQVAFYFGQELATLIYSLKYRDELAYGRLLGELLVERIDVACLQDVEALIAVPLFPKRYRQRGYNQAELIAESLSKRLNIPLIKGAVRRIKATTSQTHLNAEERRKNLKKAFSVEASKLAGLSKIAIVDDVITTGATMHSLAEQIKGQSAVKTIQAWAVAKTR